MCIHMRTYVDVHLYVSVFCLTSGIPAEALDASHSYLLGSENLRHLASSFQNYESLMTEGEYMALTMSKKVSFIHAYAATFPKLANEIIKSAIVAAGPYLFILYMLRFFDAMGQ